jgi:hypothetical protein
MSKIDDMIEETLSEEERALLEHYASEPGWVRQALGLFQGRLGWVMRFVFLVQILLFLAALYCLWELLTVKELMSGLRWGVGAVVLVQLSTLLRSFMGMQLEANRVLREIKRLELRLVRMESSERR